MAEGPQLLMRTSPTVLELRALRGAMLVGPYERLFRDRRAGVRAGETFVAGGLTVQVRALGAAPGSVQQIALTLDEPWDAPDVQLLLPTPVGLARVPVPPVGRAAPVPPALIPWR
jgi:hypothetical protein